MRFVEPALYFLEPRSVVFIEKAFYTPFTAWHVFLGIWQRRGGLVAYTLDLLKLSANLPQYEIAKPLYALWWQSLAQVVSRLLFFCQIRYVALSRQLRKILKNKYRFTKQLKFVGPSKRLQVTFRHITSYANLQEESLRRPLRLIQTLRGLLENPQHPFIITRDLQQKQTLASLITKQLQGGNGLQCVGD